jgi:hypothetical protein
MASSTLDPDNLTAGPDRRLGRGHGTSALGPSDTSDSGSDLKGAPTFAKQSRLAIRAGTTAGPEDGTGDSTTEPDLGDLNLDSDTDSVGTGERAAAGRDTVRDGADIDVDTVKPVEQLQRDLDDDEAKQRQQKPPLRH